MILISNVRTIDNILCKISELCKKYIKIKRTGEEDILSDKISFQNLNNSISYLAACKIKCRESRLILQSGFQMALL